MAGLFDVQAMVILQDAWATLSGDATTWAACFQGKIASSLAETWRGLLNTAGVHFTMAWQPDLPNAVQVIVEMNDEASGEQFLGDDSGTAGVAVMELQETLTLTAHARNPELVRAIHKPLRACMVRSRDKFIAEGLEGLIYRNGGGLGPEMALLPDGVYARRQIWAVLAEDRIPLGTPDQTAKSIYVAASDVTVNGIAGGVTPVTED